MRVTARCMTIMAMVGLLNAPAFAADPWSAQDVALQVTYSALHVIDWGQTRDIAANPGRFHEHNILLGEHPSKDRVDLYFAGTLVAHALVTHFLPQKCRPWWQAVTIGIEATCVGLNYAAGIKVRF